MFHKRKVTVLFLRVAFEVHHIQPTTTTTFAYDDYLKKSFYRAILLFIIWLHRICTAPISHCYNTVYTLATQNGRIRWVLPHFVLFYNPCLMYILMQHSGRQATIIITKKPYHNHCLHQRNLSSQAPTSGPTPAEALKDSLSFQTCEWHTCTFE